MLSNLSNKIIKNEVSKHYLLLIYIITNFSIFVSVIFENTFFMNHSLKQFKMGHFPGTCSFSK